MNLIEKLTEKINKLNYKISTFTTKAIIGKDDEHCTEPEDRVLQPDDIILIDGEDFRE